MNIQFDQDVDAVYLRLSDEEILDSEAVDEDVVYGYSVNDQVVGVELLRVRANLPQLAVMALPFQNLEQQYELLQFIETIADAALKSNHLRSN